MNIGKIQESVLKRSVFRQLKTKRQEVLFGAGPGEDCAILTFPSGQELLVSAQAAAKTGCDAALAASLFHYRELTVGEVKAHLQEKNIPVRL